MPATPCATATPATPAEPSGRTPFWIRIIREIDVRSGPVSALVARSGTDALTSAGKPSIGMNQTAFMTN